MNLNNLNIFPDPKNSANVAGGVNSVVFDHAVGFLNAGYSINSGDGPHIVHAIAESSEIDVFHCHGLYPIGEGFFDHSYSRSNDIVLSNALKAKTTICISEFSANLLRHKLHIDPIVTRNGIWTSEYVRAGSPSGAVLFPKASLDANARADDVLWLKNNTDLKLLSIANIKGVKSLGPLDRDSFIKTLQSSAIYLATTKENNSMATMEAMITGVPVVGYNQGFCSEWLKSGIGCELVPPGDFIALEDAIQKVLSNWQKYSKSARDYAGIFDWQPVIDLLLKIYERAQADEPQNVSIIIPCHNYGRWVGEAIESALNQSVTCEVIVINDNSTDDSASVISRYAKKVSIITNETNLGVAEARNKAITQAKGTFIVCLDADDRLHPNFVEKHLQSFHSLDDAIAYAPILFIDSDGGPRGGGLFRQPAITALQSSGKNQIPSCNMFRKSWWLRVGGYEGRYSPAEDAHLWMKIFAYGGQARRASNQPLMDYRVHSGSLSSKGFPNWWDDWNINYSSPIQERDSKITIVLDKADKDLLWAIEKQDYQNWAVEFGEERQDLQQVFPWLNKGTSKQVSRIHLTAGTLLPQNFLSEYLKQTPEWITNPRKSQLLSPAF
jgi:hypothetical protein